MADSNSSTDNPDRYVLFRYHPSLGAAILFSVLFFLTTAFHIYQSFRKRAWFLIPFIIGGIFSTTGYTARILCSKDQWALGPFLTQSLVLLLAPALFAASIYMILGRIILLVGGEHFSPIRRTWMTKLFVAGDILSFWIQGVGGGIMASGEPQKLKTGEYIIIGGLLLQVIVFGLFVVVAVIFQRRGRELLAQVSKQVPWKRHLYTLYGTSILILVRSLVRVIEYIQGNNGYLLRHEVFLYVFDALLMFAVMIAMNFANPGDIALMLKEKRSCEVTEELREVETSQERTVNARAAWV